MAHNLNVLPQSPRLSKALRCSIADISPTIQDRASKFIDGVVSLVWPYSSATRQLAVLIAERDFRIRKAKGQTRIIFHGHAAVAVAQSHVGIGDTVHLSLAGAQWTQSREDVATLGKRADWDLEYARELFMEVHRDTIPLAVIDVSHVEEPPCRPLHENVVNGTFATGSPRTTKHKELWPSPPFVRQTAHPSSPSEEVALRSFIEDDGYMPGQGRKRAKFSRDSGSWRYVEKSSRSVDEKPGSRTPSPVHFQQGNIRQISKVPEFERGDGSDTVPDVGRPFKNYDPALQHQNGSATESAGAPSIPTPVPLPTLTVVAGDPSTTKPAYEVEKVSAHEEGHQKPKRIVPSPEATTRPLLPLASSRLPQISPLVEQQGAVTEYLPLISNTQSELDFGAAAVPEDLYRKSQADATMLLTRDEASNGQLASVPPGDGIGKTVLQPSSEIIDLTSSLDDDDNLHLEEPGRDLQNEASAGEDDALNPERPVPPPDEFEFLNDSPVDPQLDHQRSLLDVLHRPNMSETKTALPESLAQSPFTGEPLRDVVPPHYGPDGDSNQVVPHSKEATTWMFQLEKTARASIDQLDDTLFPNLLRRVVAVEQDDVEQEHILPTASSASRGISHCADAVEISAGDVKDKACQAQHRIQVTHRYMSNGKFYDGAEDRIQSPSTEQPDDNSKKLSERESLNDNNEGSPICGKIGTPNKRSESHDDGSGMAARERSTSARTEINASQIVEATWTTSVDRKTKLLEEPGLDQEMKHAIQGRGKKPELSPKAREDDVGLTGDRSDDQVPLTSEVQDDARKLPEISFSPSSSAALVQDTTIVTIPSTKAHLHDDPHTTEQTPILADTALEDAAGSQFSKRPDEYLVGVEQLATPTNTQEELRHPQVRDLPQKLFEEKPEVELPLSPETTQDLQDSRGTKAEMSDKEEEEQTILIGPTNEQLRSRLQELATLEDSSPILLKEARRRRSSRLSGTMPLLAKDPSAVVSPYFTPKRPTQHDEQDVPSSLLHRPLSPKLANRPNIVVQIPPPAEKRPLLGVQEPSIQAPSSSVQPPLPNRPFHAKGFTTPHSYYPSLSSLPTHFDDLVDVLAVSTTTSKRPQRAKSGPKDHFSSLKFVDSSCAAGDAVTVQLFRPYKTALPVCQRGDILLLRNMKVQTRRTLDTNRKDHGKGLLDGMILLSTESSAWAVFKFPIADAIPATEGRSGSTEGPARSPAERGAAVKMNVQINGPPVEFGAEEKAFARGLDKWWVEEGRAMFPDLGNKSSPESIESKKVQEDTCEDRGDENGNVATLRSMHHHFGLESHSPAGDAANVLHEHELRGGMAYGDAISPKPMHEHHEDHSLDHSTISTNAASDNSGPEEQESALHEHELRDGMAYGDTISPKPMHEHHEDHSLDHSAISTNAASNNSGPEEEQEAALHEHELRDGMAYGDTISPYPMHEHSPYDDHHSTSHENHASSPARDHHKRKPSLASTVPPHDQTEPSHTLRNGISYGESSTSAASTPLRAGAAAAAAAAAKASTRQSEDAEDTEEEAVHGLRSGRKYVISSPASPRPGSSGGGTTSARTAATAARPRSSRAERRRKQ